MPDKGVDKLSFVNYCNLPGLLVDRLFSIIESTEKGYASRENFISTMCKIYCSTIDEKIRLSFDMYDFDSDGKISQEDARLILSYIPISSSSVSVHRLNET